MSLKQIFKNVLVPCAAGVAVKNGHTYGANCVKRADEFKPSELPIYSDVCCTCREQKKEEPPSQIEETIGNIRKELWVWQDNIRGYRHKFVEVYNANLDQMKGPEGGAHDKCSDRGHLKNSLDDSCYSSLPYSEERFPETKETKELKCRKPSWPVGRTPKKFFADGCSKRESCKPKSESEVCSCCRQRASGCKPQK